MGDDPIFVYQCFFIAVLDLDIAKGIPVEAKISLSDLMREQLWKTGRFRVIDRNNMQRILNEQGGSSLIVILKYQIVL